MIDWSRIDTVLPDMDGTLIDLRFDNHLSNEVVGDRYGEREGLGESLCGDSIEANRRRFDAPRLVPASRIIDSRVDIRRSQERKMGRTVEILHRDMPTFEAMLDFDVAIICAYRRNVVVEDGATSVSRCRLHRDCNTTAVRCGAKGT